MDRISLKNILKYFESIRMQSIKHIFLINFSIMAIIGVGWTAHAFIWAKASNQIYESVIRCIKVHPLNDSEIFVGTSKALYRSANKGRDYKIVLRPQGRQASINDVFISKDPIPHIYAATDSGLYESTDNGNSFKRIYSSFHAQAGKCFSFIKHDNELYVGTQKGLFYRESQDKNWKPYEKGLSDKPVYLIQKDLRFVYFATDRDLYRWSKLSDEFIKIFSVGLSTEVESYEDNESTVYSENKPLIKAVEIKNSPQGAVIIGTTKGIYRSDNAGRQWKRLDADHMPWEELTSLVVLEKMFLSHGNGTGDPKESLHLLAGTKRGAFFYREGRWTPIYKGMETNVIYDVAENTDGIVYAATNKGVFYLPVAKALPPFSSEVKEVFSDESDNQENISYENISKFFIHEPDIKEIHELAVDYAEVHPEKISQWRHLAKKRAWFPKVTMGVDGDRNRTIGDSLWGSYGSGGQHYVGPDDKTFYDNFSWDISLSWELGDLIWSTDQTTIDSRSKLMVELREDVLDQVTRLFFERRRIQVELISLAQFDPQVKIDKEMRIDELTALIDAFTGGEFSRRIRKK